MPIQNNRQPMSITKLFSAFAAAFKAMPDSQLADISDSLDINGPHDTGRFGTNADHASLITGPAESMSGSVAETFVHDYSKDVKPGNGINQGYQALAEQMAFMNTRMQKSEAAISSIAMLIAQSLGKSDVSEMFGAGAKKSGDESDERDEEKDDEGEIDKAGNVHVRAVASVPSLFRELASYSRNGGKSSTPPQMHVAKAGYRSKADELMAQAAAAYDAGDAKSGLHYQTLAVRHRAAAAGAEVDSRLLHHMSDGDALKY
jgi:hypothetical protein